MAQARQLTGLGLYGRQLPAFQTTFCAWSLAPMHRRPAKKVVL